MWRVSRKVNLFRLTLPSLGQGIRRLALSPSRAEDSPHIKHNPYSREFPSTLTQVAYIIRRFLKYSLIGVFSLSSTAFLLFHGAHLYVEKISLASEDYRSDPRTTHIVEYQWDQELEDWTGPSAIGGTDPSLSWRARQAIRSAWMSLNWGRSVASVSDGDAVTQSGNDNRLVPALNYLNLALQDSSDSQSRFALLELQGNILCALNSVESMAFAGASYQAALEGVPADSLHAAKLYSRLAEVLGRLKNSDAALDACWTAIGILDSSKFTRGQVPPRLPNSPSATRLLLQNLVALSASYASSGDYKMTAAFQLAVLNLASNLDMSSRVDHSPGRLLHQIYLQQRIATIRLHLGEVKFAMDQQVREPLQLLSDAAIASERVALTLSGVDNMLDHPSPPPVLSPIAAFTSTKALSQPSKRLLLDASRSAAAAYHLSAILHEKQGGKGYQDAVRCLEKALWWCGGSEGPSASTPLVEWEAIWKDYKRLRALAYPTRPVQALRNHSTH